MTIILSIISLLALATFITVYVVRKHNANEYGEKDPSKKSLIIPSLLCVLAFILSSSFVVIPTNYSGVKTTFGQISDTVLHNGFNWKVPFIQSVEKVNNKLQDIKFEDTVSAETSARTEINYANITVTYQIMPESSSWIYANVSDYENNLISQDLVGSAIKSASKTLNDTDATNRSILDPTVAKSIQTSINEKYGSGVVKIVKVVVKDADFSDDYNKAIAAKQKAQLESEKQAIQNKKNIAKAKADAEVKKTKAQANADAKLIAAKAEKAANEMKEKSITENILKEEYINKWNGTMPKYVGDGSTMMFSLNE